MMLGGNNQVTTQNEGGGSNQGGKECSLPLKKGPWTAAEDAVLAEYVRTHGEGNWNAVQKNTGLARCGKSCRLRWANHLRPNLKKGAFSAEEERIIVELHAMMGNKWARMASRLPGRTDNEIKNYWNTRVKRRQRQGLPLYPPDIQTLYNSQHHSQSLVPTKTASSFSFQNPMTEPLHSSSSLLTAPSSHHVITSLAPPQLLHYDLHSASTPPPPLYSPSPASTPHPPSTPPPQLPSPSSLSTPPHVSPLQSPHNYPSSTLPLVDSFNSTSSFYFPRPLPSLEIPHRRKRFKHDDGSESSYNDHNIAVNCGSNSGSSFMLPFPPLLKTAHPFNPHAVTVTNSSLTRQHYHPSYSLDPTTLNLASSSTILYPHFDSRQFISTPGFDYLSKTELPSNQFFSQDGNLSEVNNNYSSNNQKSNHHSSSLALSENGLLEDMLEEAQVLAGNYEITGSQSCLVGSSASSEGLASVLKAKKETTEQVNTTTATNEEYSNVIPSSVAVPEWYIGSGGEGSNGQSSAVTTDDNLGFELHQIASLFPVDIADDTGWAPSSRSLDNFPGIF